MRTPFSTLPRSVTMRRRLAQLLVMAAQLVLLFVPLAEAHADRALRAHVEAPRSTPHPGQHDQKFCPACTLLSMHGRVEPRAQVPSIVQCVTCTAPRPVVRIATVGNRVSSSSRAPPVSP